MTRWITDKKYAYYTRRLYEHFQRDGIAYCDTRLGHGCGKTTNLEKYQ